MAYTTAERLDYLLGQQMANSAALRLLMHVHPHGPRLRALLAATAAEDVLVEGLNTPVTEAFSEGLEDARRALATPMPPGS
jgi:hypothetical protein